MHFSFIFLVLVYLTFAFGDSLICNNGFTVVNSNKCLKLFSSAVKHRTAEANCASYGGTLVNIRNSIDNRAVTQFVGNIGLSFWIGVYCLESNNPSSCYFDDDLGTDTAFNNFAKGFPNTDIGGCVYSATSGSLAGQWISSECDNVEMAYVCEIPMTRADSCAHNYNGYCYIMSHENSTSPILSFNDAYKSCQDNCANLVSIHSRRELSYIQGIYSPFNISSVTIGGLSTAPMAPYWSDLSH